MARERVSLVRVARIYTEAVDGGLPPTKTVSAVLGLPYNTASKKVAAAREMRLLPPARHRSLDHRPAQAEIHRGRPTHRRFSVCESCLVPYPCDYVKEVDGDA